MIEKLRKIDIELRKLEDKGDFTTTNEQLMNRSKDEIMSIVSSRANSTEKIRQMEEHFLSISQSLSSHEIATAYTECGTFLRQILAYHIYANFNDDFIPIVRLAIDEDHEVAYRLIANLPKSSEGFYEFVNKILDSKWSMNVEIGLSMVKNHNINQLTQKVKEFANHENKMIAEFAAEVLEHLS
jgi:hypothetical protein